MTIPALVSAVRFFTTLPVGARSRGDWEEFTNTPATIPVVGYVVGGLVSLPVLLASVLDVPAVTLGFVLVVWLYAVTGVNHLDGLADLADAAAAHSAEDRRDVMKDVDVGVGGTAAVAAAILAVFSAGVALAAPPPVVAAVVVVSAEVASKASVAVMTCVGDAAHEGLGSRFTEPNGPLGVLPIVVLSAPAAVLSIPLGTLVSVPVVLSAAVAAAAVHLWSGSRLGGVSGDVFGAANEAARIAALHTGVLLWTLL